MNQRLSIRRWLIFLKTANRKNKILLGVSMIGLLAISYWIFSYALFDIHGMKQWVNILAIVSFIIIIIAFINNRRIISMMTIVGYIGGFILAMLFNTDGIDQGGGRINNGWIIWVIVFIVAILAGVILELIGKHSHKNSAKKDSKNNLN